MKSLTVFTPTYNRAYILGQLYESLKRQTSKDFYWLIVDDGSTDNTKEVVEAWILEHQIDIRYYYQGNGGKMRAHNYGVTLCDTELFMCCDSDDYLTDDAVELICNIWNNYEGDKSFLNGVIGPKSVYKNGVKIENKIPDNYKVLSIYDFTRRCGKVKETFLAFRRSIINQYPFPVQEGEKFIPEGIVLYKLDDNYKMLVLSKEIMICNYLEDGYTKNGIKLYMENPKGMILIRNESVRRNGFSKRGIISAVYYVVASLINKEGMSHIVRNSNNKLLTIIFMPIGFIKYYQFKYMYNKTIVC